MNNVYDYKSNSEIVLFYLIVQIGYNNNVVDYVNVKIKLNDI